MKIRGTTMSIMDCGKKIIRHNNSREEELVCERCCRVRERGKDTQPGTTGIIFENKNILSTLLLSPLFE